MKRRWITVGILLMLVGGLLSVRGRGGQTAVRGKSPAQQLAEPLNHNQRIAQDVALADENVQALTLGERSEVMSIKPVGQHVTPASALCLQTACQQVEIYSFDANSTVAAIVETESRTVLDVLYQPGLQPGINRRLADRAIEIALNHPDVIAELGFQPKRVDMAPVAAGMVGSLCDQRLCAGPTFEVDNRILWAIVDLTTETLVGVNWTEVPRDGHAVSRPDGGESCPSPGVVDRGGWRLSYETTGTDGLRVFDATFNGQAVLHSAKLVEWHVDYNGTYHIAGFLDVTGCGGTGGFFVYPTGETALLDLVEGADVVGFELVQDFRMEEWGEPCNYRYEQRMQFYDDGRFRIVSGAYGRGCGFFPVYRPVVRIDLALDDAEQELTGIWSGERWTLPETELILSPDETLGEAGHAVAANGAMLWQMNQEGRGFYMIPGAGQFDDGGRGDMPFVYLTRFDPAEGAADLPLFGGLCCEDDHKQGPHLFVDNQRIQHEGVVLWYVAQHQTEVSTSDPTQNYCWAWFEDGDSTNPPETAPCLGGPMFVPFDGSGEMKPGFEINQTTFQFPETAVFTNTSTSTGGFPYNFHWEFGDGHTSHARSPTHQYLLDGMFTPALTMNAFANGAARIEETTVTVQVNNQFLPWLSQE